MNFFTLAKFKLWGVAIVGFITLLVGAKYRGKKEGKAEAKAEQYEELIDDIRQAKEALDRVDDPYSDEYKRVRDKHRRD